MNQGGKHAAEPARLENKRERRRGAAGRAAVLRRAPSDSDCSGETASLSADSGDRAPRPAPLAQPRATKTRSRRRGSEWEVLEGLKDGQRFEKRPDVFNGYLHKKRKWPLKGWHKRFFVVDGGILVYARSPTDVARGRLHGSVDVGLSVISAKARRRRIDIDADEFIYHLRAKTPELFRTWLNVLKAHRLYRQHLLTFGARESVPKIHPPLEDLPATDNSSHASFTSDSTTATSVENLSPGVSSPIPDSPIDIESSEYNNKDHSVIFQWQQDPLSINSLIPLNFESLEQNLTQSLDEHRFDLTLEEALCHNIHNISMCSMKCVANRLDMAPVEKKTSTPGISINTTDTEKQMTCTNLDSNLNPKKTKEQSNAPMIDKSMRSRKMKSVMNKNMNVVDTIKTKEDVNYAPQKPNRKRSPFVQNNQQETTACFFFTRKKNKLDLNSPMRKSRKCTNLVKYKNACEEPPLRALTSKCMLLGKYKVMVNDSNFEKAKTKDSALVDGVNQKAVACNVDVVLKENNEVQVMTVKEHKSSQKASTPADYDKVAEKLIVNIFERCNTGRKQDVKFYIEQVVQDLYDVKANQEMHPVKELFRNLLEYWLKNTSVTQFKQAMTNEKSVDQSKINLCKDANLSSFLIKMKSKETQFHGLDDVKVPHKCNMNTATSNNPLVTRRKVKEIKYENKGQSTLPRSHSHRRDTTSFEKESRIQELERLLKNTVYMCEMGGKSFTKEKDIEITKQLIEHIGVQSKNNTQENDTGDKLFIGNSGSSAEIPEIQETINHLLSDTEIPPDVAKEFLGAYLDVLLQDSSKSSSTSQSSDWEHTKELADCEVVGESIIRKVSKSVTTLNALANEQKNDTPKLKATTDIQKQIDPGQVYLKDILEKVTTIFSKVKNMEDNTWFHNKSKKESRARNEDNQKTIKDELGRAIIKSKYDLIYENCDQNSLVIDLSKYNLEHISMFNDPAIKDMMSITIKLKEKPLNNGKDIQATHLGFKFPDDGKPITVTSAENCENWLPFLNAQNTTSNDIFQNLDTNRVTCNFETELNKIDPKLYFSNISDGTSKAHRFRDGSCTSSDVPNTTQTCFTKDTLVEKNDTEDLQPCYLLSIKKGALGSKFQNKKNIANKHECVDSIKLTEEAPNKSTAVKKPDDLSVFERPAPKTIDEKFILLLLENLSYISRTVSSMHKDINTLYVKMKKKYDKYAKNNNIHGLSLLGKIYSEDTCYKDGDDKETQCDINVLEKTYKVQDTKTASTNTNINRIGERSQCAYTHTPMLIDSSTQTDNIYIVSLKTSSSSHEMTFESKTSRHTAVIETNTVDISVKEQSTSNPNWLKAATTDTGVNTIVRYVFKDPVKNAPLKSTRPPFSVDKQALKKNFTRVKEELMKEISLLPPTIKVSTQAQTDRQLIRFLLDKKDSERKDTYIYQLFKSKKCTLTSSSVTCSTLDVELSDDIRTLYRCSSYPSICSGLLSPTAPPIRGPQAGFVSGTPGGRFAGWIIESGGPLEVAARELGQAQLSVQQLQRLLDALELHQHHDTDVSLEGASPNVKKDRRKFGLRKKKSNSKCASVELAPHHIDPSSSHTALSSLSALTAPPSPGGGACSAPTSAASLPIACAAARPQSLPGAETLNTAQGPASITSLTPDHQLREDFTVLAKDLVASLKGIVSSMVCERGRLRAALDAAEAAATPGGAVVSALRTNLTSALQQNSELRTRLSRIHDTSDIAEILSIANSETITRQFQQSLSYSSSCVSASEFFDAEEHEDDDPQPDDVIPTDEAGVIELDGDSSSEAGSLSSEEGSASSDNSDGAMLSAEQVTLRHSSNGPRPPSCWTRRTRLPAPRPAQGGPSLWNLLYKNIGKDLSQISMPVTINEPLNMLQRLCEELEYSELLDSAAACGSAIERAALIAAFAVSAYAASAHRAASKPFNPLLSETYECVRDDRGFRFLAEQVSHHPPISACHAESPRWCFWQEARIKTKFWGKSMEFQPTGRVHVRLNTTGDHYTWNKVTTCVHNLFGGQRWVDQYGDMHIVCVGTDISCKLNFVKASSWSQTRHEVRGAVTEARTGARVRLAGRWSEALYAGEPPAARCLWRPGAMPPEHEMYYGFTRFAMELNEMEPGMRDLLPHTDTRLRPDQRALEEGDVESAEGYKHSLEQAQRERRRESPAHQPAWFRKAVEEGEETWVFSGEYWKAREAGFSEDGAHRIW